MKSRLTGIYLLIFGLCLYVWQKDVTIAQYLGFFFIGFLTFISKPSKIKPYLVGACLGIVSMMAYTDYKGFEWISNRDNWANTSITGWTLMITLIIIASFGHYIVTNDLKLFWSKYEDN